MNVNATGQYICNILLTCGDTLVEKFNVIAEQQPILNLSDSLVYCQGTSAYIVSGVWDEHTQVLWNDNSKDSIKLIASPGLYTLSATNICGVFKDSLLAIEMPLPKADLGRDTAYCSAFSHFFDFSSSPNNFIWNDSSKSKIRTITQPGIYWLKASNMCGSDYDMVSIIRSFVPQVNLGNDTALKMPFALMLDAQNPGANYKWNTKDSGKILMVHSFGTYWVRVSTPCGEAIDSIVITDAASANRTNEMGVTVYPNPTTGILYITSKNQTIKSVEIVNVLGKLVLSKEWSKQNSTSFSIDLNDLVSGIYSVRINYANEVFIWKNVIKEE